MPITPRQFGFWFKGSPDPETGDGSHFNKWWKGSPVVQTAGALNTFTVVGSGGIAIGGTAPVVHNTSSLQYGGIAIGGAATVAVQFQRTVATIRTGTYTGDGTSSQSIFVGYKPIAVMVFGLDGSSNEIGAVWTQDMAAAKSHPWDFNVATTSSERDNRITGATSTGFTIGSDLNLSGRPFLWIAFPPSVDGVAIGTYAGSGIALATPTTLTISGTAASALSAFASGDVGRTIYRVSDNTSIGVITTFINSSNVTVSGGVDGTYTGSTWYIGTTNSRRIPLGFTPDLVVLWEDSTLLAGTPVPLCLSPDITGTAINGSNQDFGGHSASPASAAIYSGTDYIQLVNLNSGTGDAQYDKSGVTYYWIALKTELSDVFLDKIDYVGDGASSRTISGLTFQPEAVIVVHSATTGKVFGADSAACPTGHAFQMGDGVAQENAGITLMFGGMLLSTNNLNTSGTYRAIFLAPTTVGTGGIAIGGAATVAQIFVVIAMTGSGGIAIGGAATTNIAHVVTASGGIAIGGAATTNVLHTITASGGIAVGGAAAITHTHVVAAAGGVAIGGAPQYTYFVSQPPPGHKKHVKQGQGGIRIGGKGKVFHKHIGPPHPPSRFVYHGDGGITIGGTAGTIVNFAYTASSGIAIGGQATVTTTPGPVVYTVVGSGGIAVGGVADIAITYNWTADGGIAVGGAADLVVNFVWTADGGIAIGGQATVLHEPFGVTYTVVGEGGIAIGGEAATRIIITRVVVGEGGIAVGGTSPFDVKYNPPAFGGIEIGGQAGVIYTPVPPPTPTTPVIPERGGGASFAKGPMWRVPVCEGRAVLHGKRGLVEARGNVIDMGQNGQVNQLLEVL